jgi:hypothetical protein
MAKLKDEYLTQKLLDLFQLALARLLLFLVCIASTIKLFTAVKKSVL